MQTKFNERKATQLVALILDKLGGQKNILPLMKIAYLIDREAVLKFKTPFTGDFYAAMEHGMVLSTTYDLCKPRHAKNHYWDNYIERVPNSHYVQVIRDPDTEVFSKAELQFVLERIEVYKNKSTTDLIDEIHHKQLPEWIPVPKGKSKSVEFKEMLGKTGLDEDKIDFISYNTEVSSLFESAI